MKNRYSLGIIFAVLACAATFTGCKKHYTSVMLPAEDQVYEDMNFIDGTFKDYYVVEAQSYQLDMTDSLPVMTLKLRTIKQFVPPSKDVDISTRAWNEADTTLTMPHIALLDSVDHIVPITYLCMDTTQVAQLNALMKGEPGNEVEIKFVGKKPLTQAQKDSIGENAVSFKLIADARPVIDPEIINKALKRFRRAMQDYNNLHSGPPPCGIGVMIAYESGAEMRAAKAAVEKYEEYFDLYQQMEYRAIRDAKVRCSWD